MQGGNPIGRAAKVDAVAAQIRNGAVGMHAYQACAAAAEGRCAGKDGHILPAAKDGAAGRVVLRISGFSGVGCPSFSGKTEVRPVSSSRTRLLAAVARYKASPSVKHMDIVQSSWNILLFSTIV